MALFIIAALVLVPLVLLIADTALGLRRHDEKHIPYAKKVGYDSMAGSVGVR